ncbi:hypothetical protein GCM10027422_16820 [Hymenobacter arcticus]
MKLANVFTDSFDTFKVFDKLSIQQANLINYSSPNSVWQILNHLVIWQGYQIDKFCNISTEDIKEITTWPTEKKVSDQSLLNDKIMKFNEQLEMIKIELGKMTVEQEGIERKLKIIQDLTIHLSFHIGEMILIMRQNGYYPMPSEMNAFLA